VNEAPGDLDALAEARRCLQSMDFAEAERLLRCSIERDPHLRNAYELLGKLLYRDARSDEAAAVYRRWLAALPADPVAAHLVAATGGERGARMPLRASDSFISDVFDRAATEFDTALANLGYQAPSLLFERVAQIPRPADTEWNALDLGCGTGLCGLLLRPLVTRLVGVDLSRAMLAQAQARGCYDQLLCAEITSFMRTHGEQFDLITAADVLCYFGDLTAVLTAACACLRPGGWIVFSVEAGEAGEAGDPGQIAGFSLLEHGRYTHTTACVETVLSQAGFREPTLSRGMLRFERGAPVDGLIVSASRPPR